MASKHELITELADVTAKRIASDRLEWTKYLKTVADRIAGDYTKDILPDLKNAQEDSFLEGLDDLKLEIRLRETLSSSIAYTLLSRCGLDADD